MSNQFHIEKVRCPARVQVEGVGVLEGEIFLQPTMPYRTGPQRPQELLEDRDPFFPLAVRPDEYRLIAKDGVVWVGCPMSEDEDVGIEPVPVEVRLRDGSTVQGEVLTRMRSERARLLDFLNGFDGRFLAVRTTEGECFINRRYLSTVAQVTRPQRVPG